MRVWGRRDGVKWRNVREWMGDRCLCEWTVIWKSENIWCWCNVSLYNKSEEWTGDRCLSQWTVIWKSENICCWCNVSLCVHFDGAGIAQWLERRTRIWTVACSNPCWNGRRIFFSTVDFLCWLLFRYPFHPRVTAVARKNPGHPAKNAGSRLQLNTHAPYVCGLAWSDIVHGCMVCTELAPRRLQFHVAPAMPAL